MCNTSKKEKIKIKKITILYAEGKCCDKYPKKFESIDEINSYLIDNCEKFPHDGGYDKHKFIVKWNDGEDYNGTLCCKHNSCKNNDLDLRKHIVDNLSWYSGTKKNPWC